MSKPKGLASKLWGRYNPRPHRGPLKPHVKLVQSDKKPKPPDPACDYIEDAQWWLARSERSPRELQLAFEDQEVACLLYETVGAFLELGRQGSQYLIAIQVINAGEWDVDLCLEDAKVYLEEPMSESQLADFLYNAK